MAEASFFSRVDKAVRGLFQKAESAPVAPSAEEREHARGLMVTFDSDRPTTDALADGLRTLLERLGNPVMINKEFGDSGSSLWKHQADFLMESVRQILEVKKTADLGRAPFYDQAIRLTHAIQGEARALRQKAERQKEPNVFLRAEDFSEEKRRQDEEKIAVLRQERSESRARQDASIRQVSREFVYALSQLDIDLSDRNKQFLQGIEGRALNFHQFLMADHTLRERTQEPSLSVRVQRMQRSSDIAEREWAAHVQMLMNMLEDLTARGSVIETVILPSRPRVRRVAAGSEEQGETAIAAK